MITAEEVTEAVDTIMAALTAEGLTSRELAKLLKKELKAKETKCFKGTVRHLSKEGFVERQEDMVIYSKPLAAWDIRQRARMDAHKLRGDYPPERRAVEITGDPDNPLLLNEANRKYLTDLALIMAQAKEKGGSELPGRD